MRSDDEMLRIEAIMLAGMRELQATAAGDIAQGQAAEMILAEHDIDDHSEEFAKELDMLCEDFNMDRLFLVEKAPQKYFWYLQIWEDVVPMKWAGPFNTWDEMVAAMRRAEHSQPDLRDGMYWLESEKRPAELQTISGTVFMED